MLDVGRFVERFAYATRRGRLSAQFACFDALADIVQARVTADRARLLTHQLHAVVTLRVVAGGDHDATICLVMAGGEVDFLGAAQADVDHVGATFGQTLHQGTGQAWAFKAHVTSYHVAASAQLGHQGAANAVGDVVVEVGRHLAADVIGFEATSLDRCVHTSLICGADCRHRLEGDGGQND
ncbi:hypothetical protein D3C79_686510 [compost metagenome]